MRIQVRLIFFVFLLLFDASKLTYGQIFYGARSSGLNHAVTALDRHDWAVYANPATASTYKRVVSLYYVRYYGLNELADMAFSASYPTPYGVLLTGIRSYGFDLYRETDISLGWMYAYQTLKSAVKLHYDHIAFPSPYGNAFALGVDVGLLFELSSSIQVGAQATNVNRPNIGASNEERPRIMSVGFAYRPLKQGVIVADLVKDVRFPVGVRLGIEYPIVDVLVLRAGVGNQPVNTTFGAGLRLKKLSVNLAVEKHQDLGWSPGLDVGFQF